MKPEELEKMPLQVEKLFYDLQKRVMEDVVRRIKKTGEITSTADYQIEKMIMMGQSSEFIEAEIKRLTQLTDAEIYQLYEDVIDKEYTRNKTIYEQVNANFIPYEESPEMQAWVSAIVAQTKADIKNITQSMGFALKYDGKIVFTPFAEYYQKYLDRACMDIITGTFSYNTVLRRVIKEMASSGIRTVDYASGHSNRITVAARRAVMTGVNQLCGQINQMNADKLGTDTYEVPWHAGARPSHWWGGMIFTMQELIDICGLGTGEGIGGWNCYHPYYAFVPGISVRQYTDDQLAELNAKEKVEREWKGKKYNAYNASQKQRQMETAMRAQREKVYLLQKGGADPDEIMIAKAKYQGQLNEYSRFCKKMKLPEDRERIYLDLRGKVATNTKLQNAKYTKEMIKNADRDTKQYYRYKNIIGDGVGSLADFRQMKYNKPKEFELLTDYANSVKSGMISSLSGFDNYKKLYRTIEKDIVGMEASTGIKITGQSKHFMERVIGTREDPKTHRPRSGVSVEDIQDALLNGEVRRRERDPNSIKFVTDNCIVSVNPNTGILIQCNPQ
ncbi:phage minor capsid protein [Lachnospiraceae bacterium EP-SM-12S-S03]|nr:phage minor capsid protein [Lachnospiraceae bacterium EP-SM-12S-S03]